MRDPRAGQDIAEHDVGRVSSTAAAVGKCTRATVTLKEISEFARTDMMIDEAPFTDITLSDADSFTGFVISHRDDDWIRRRDRNAATGQYAASSMRLRARTAGALYPDVGAAWGRGCRAVWGKQGAARPRRTIEMFGSGSPGLQGMFGGKLDPMLFEPGHTVAICGVKHLKVVDGEFLDGSDRTYAGRIFLATAPPSRPRANSVRHAASPAAALSASPLRRRLRRSRRPARCSTPRWPTRRTAFRYFR